MKWMNTNKEKKELKHDMTKIKHQVKTGQID